MRVQLSGEGEPIPLEAMPVPGEGSDFILELAPGTFTPADYIALGFVYYEAWCIGGAGGRGGDSASQAVFVNNPFVTTLSSSDWALQQELTRIQDYFTTGEWDHQYIVSGNYPLEGGGLVLMTAAQMEARRNPGHKITINQYSHAALYTTDQHSAQGGSGGGGGLHVVAGDLADLPSSVPVVVGAAGTDAGYGQVVTNDPWTPLPDYVDYAFNTTGYADPERRMFVLINYFNAMTYKYPAPRTAFAKPVAGGDGGASSFNDMMCCASGGKGGSPGKVWNSGTSSFVPNGAGGAGGKGGQTTAGGGAAGGNDGNIDGSNGTWDGAIGKGGGGGRGPASPNRKSGNGGIGSYSFSDTTVSGPKEFKSTYTGGGGGGAHLKTHKFGSLAKGYSPNGAVLLRIIKA